jgi:hypothetical protein
MRKELILAGGAGTRLYPAKRAISKQLLSVYNRPMTFCTLSTLVSAQIRDLLIISTPNDTSRFAELLGYSASLGMNIEYAVQAIQVGLAQAFVIDKEFIGGEKKAKENTQLSISPGFTHGYTVLSERAGLLYKTTDYYSVRAERSMIWDDPNRNITWPLHERSILPAKGSAVSTMRHAELSTISK